MRTTRIAALLAAGLFALPAATAISVAAASDKAFVAYGLDGTGTGVHVRAGTDAFPNFATGVVDNSYPLAVVHLDASPASKATASLADTGPLGATAAGQAGGIQQTQYATAAYPGTGSASQSTGASQADAAATETNADARSAYASVPPPAAGSTPLPVPALPALPTLAPLPTLPGTSSGPLAVANGLGESHAVIDQTGGVVKTTSIGSVSRATFGDGLLVIEGVTVKVEANSDGVNGVTDSTIDVGRISVAGKAVAVTDKGIALADLPVPGVPTEAVTAQLRDALAKAGITISTVAPIVDVQGAMATISATGLHVKVAQPSTAPGVPTQSLEYILGEARASAFATPASPATTPLDDAIPTAPVRTDPLTGAATSPSDTSAVFTDGSDLGSTVSGFEGASSAAPASVTRAAGTQPRRGLMAKVLHTRPVYLVFAFLAWLCLTWGTAVALLRRRRIQLALAEATNV
jgi:hypothetical protein